MATTLSKEFHKIDDENFEIKEVRETTTTINYKMVLRQMESLKKDIKNMIVERRKQLLQMQRAVDTYNLGRTDLLNAIEEFKYEFDLPDPISLETIEAELDFVPTDAE